MYSLSPFHSPIGSGDPRPGFSKPLHIYTKLNPPRSHGAALSEATRMLNIHDAKVTMWDADQLSSHYKPPATRK